jgi:hypothetical protein
VDILLPVVLFLVTSVTAYLGVRVTLHPAETPKAKRLYKVAFGVLTIIATGLIVWQSVLSRAEKTQLRTQLNQIQKNTETPPTVNVSPPTVSVEPRITVPANKAKAYVDFHHLELNWVQKESKLIVNAYAANRVSEPAQNVNARFSVALMPALKGVPSRQTQEKCFADFEKQPHKTGAFRGSLAPDQQIFGTITVSDFDQHFVDQLNSGAIVVMVIGRISFSDDNGIHRKDFCQWVQPPLFTTATTAVVTQFCESHNDLKY